MTFISVLRALLLSLIIIPGLVFSKVPRAIWDASDVALIIIDYQPEMLDTIKSGNKDLITLNTKALIRVARELDIPVVVSTVCVSMGVNRPTDTSILGDLPKGQTIVDRSTMNAWEDPAFISEVKATGKKKLVFIALYTEICLAYPVVEALQDGYQVMFITDAVGGLSIEAHNTAISRLTQAGAIPNTTHAYNLELFRDWRSPLANKAMPVFSWYKTELDKLNIPGVGTWD